MSSSSAFKIVYLGPSIGDPAVQRRVSALQTRADVLALAFDRGHTSSDPKIYSLGVAEDNALTSRLGAITLGVATLLRTLRKEQFKPSVIWARNLDNLFIALLAKLLLRSPSKIVYEVLDIHPSLTGRSIISKILRALENLCILYTSMIVVSSPLFIQTHFGKWEHKKFFHLLENKVAHAHFLDRRFLQTPGLVKRKNCSGSILLKYVGTLRCKYTLTLIEKLADSAPTNVQIHIHGRPLAELQDVFDRVVANPRVVYHGPYRYPDDLFDIYHGAHLNLCFDRSDPINGRILIPNRVYEGAAFGVPALAEPETATGMFVKAARIGPVISADMPSMLNLFEDSFHERFITWYTTIYKTPRRKFIDDGTDINRILEKL